MKFEQVKKRFPSAIRKEWNPCGYGRWMHKAAKFGRGITIGDETIIGNAIIGNNVIIRNQCVIGDGAKIGEGVFIASGTSIGKDAFIGAMADIGYGVEIYERAHIGECVILGMGARVRADVTFNKDPLHIAGLTHRVFMTAPGWLQIDTEEHEIAWWEANMTIVQRAKNYGCYVNLAREWMRIHSVA